MTDKETGDRMRSPQDDERLIERIVQEHRGSPHPGMSPARLRLHAAVHTVVENQLASGDPPVTRRTVARLTAAGVSRHAAVHAVASVVVKEMTATLRGERPFDAVAYARDLEALDPADWSSDDAGV